MSEEILKALIKLFAIITKQDGGVTEEERDYILSFFQMELDRDTVNEYISIYDKAVGYDKENPNYLNKPGLTRASVQDTLMTLTISKKINKTLSQKQKIIVLLRLLELLKADNQLTPLGVEIIDTISTIFNVPASDYDLLKQYIKFDNSTDLLSESFLIATRSNGQNQQATGSKARYNTVDIDGEIVYVRLKSVNMYFVKYHGGDDIILNGFSMKQNLAYLFPPGSTIKGPRSQASYYSDVSKLFEATSRQSEISFNATDVTFSFPNGTQGLHNINISEYTGSLIGIMGASGSGKTTLLNVLAGILNPQSGAIKINGYDLHTKNQDLDGVVGYVSQDDLLIEEITVYQNLYYNAKLCLNKLTEKELHKRVISTLDSLGLELTANLKVGSVLEKTISGGQRKRLNIALELIREPSVLFVDEPTSGLSSRDSENVMDLLKELTQKGKIIFVVIHQPSSDIYKMFDKMIVMDTGGFMIYYGNPVEAIAYFKEVTRQVDRLRSICHTCGNVTSEQIFNIVEAKVVNEFGQFTSKRKITPKQWFELYQENFTLKKVEDVKEKPYHSLERPGILKQIRIFTTRDFLSKIANKQYILINILEAPFLALILAIVVRYRNAPGGEAYIFRFNENIPGFLLMSIVVALFIGLSVSAEEIIKDRKILKREQFLNLSWSGYLVSKMIILFSLSAIQTISFVFIAHSILEIRGMSTMFWIILFSSSCMANMMGLNASSAFKSAVAVYILIPIILIPQMIFSGLMFDFDKLNKAISTKGTVPVIADFITSRWALEAMAVHQFINNDYQKPFYEYEQKIHQADFKSSFWIPAMRNKINFVANNFYKSEDSLLQIKVRKELDFVKNELIREIIKPELQDFDPVLIMYDDLSPRLFLKLNQYLNQINKWYIDIANLETRKMEKLIMLFETDERYNYQINEYKNLFFNEKLSDLARNINIKDRILEVDGRFIQQIDAVFHIPEKPDNPLNYRAHFYAPKKHFLNSYYDTPVFNIAVIWFMTLLLYLSVYFKLPEKTLALFGRKYFKRLG